MNDSIIDILCEQIGDLYPPPVSDKIDEEIEAYDALAKTLTEEQKKLLENLLLLNGFAFTQECDHYFRLGFLTGCQLFKELSLPIPTKKKTKIES